MFIPDPMIFAVAIPAVFFAGMSKGGFGSGAAFAATPILALVLDPRMALGVMLPLLMLIDVVTLNSFWKKWHAPSAKVLVLGGIPGVALGALLYQIANADVFRLLIGAVALLLVLYQFARAQGWLVVAVQPFNARSGLMAGVVAGFTSFISHAGGPPVAIFLFSQGMSKTTFQATTVLTFWVVNILKFVPYSFLGIFSVQTLMIDLWMAPVAVLGAYVGIWAHRHVPERLFFSVTYVMLVASGSKLIYDALT
jgi:uncharacterized membrane protein YfcA